MAKKVIAITGATGAQGGGLARSILADKSGEFAVRALTRKPEGEAAQALAKAGAQVVKADMDDPASVKKAFEGAHGAFCVTPFWEHMNPDREKAQVAAMVKAAKEAGLKHVVWSTLEDSRKLVPLSDTRMPTLQGRFKVPHFDAKGEADGLFRDAKVPTTFLLTSFYWENLIHFGMGPKKQPDGRYGFVLPMGKAKLPGIAVGDIGRCAHAIYKGGEKHVGKTIGISGEHLSGAEMAAALSRALKIDVFHQDVPPEVYRTFGFPGADDLGNMFQFKRDFEREFRAAREPAAARALVPDVLTFGRWLDANAKRIPIG